LPNDERKVIADYLNKYHSDAPHESASADSTFDDIYPYAPYVLRKISANLERLRKGGSL